eukprot:5561287-Pleurochrysis_carterae.AAC.1
MLGDRPGRPTMQAVFRQMQQTEALKNGCAYSGCKLAFRHWRVLAMSGMPPSPCFSSVAMLLQDESKLTWASLQCRRLEMVEA